jgi:thiamine biosynthesis lipoprotein
MDRALSASGTAVKGNHIIDPRTGRPVQDRLRAWAGAPTAALADALSTAFMVMTEAEIRECCGRHAEVSAATSSPGGHAGVFAPRGRGR